MVYGLWREEDSPSAVKFSEHKLSRIPNTKIKSGRPYREMDRWDWVTIIDTDSQLLYD